MESHCQPSSFSSLQTARHRTSQPPKSCEPIALISSHLPIYVLLVLSLWNTLTHTQTQWNAMGQQRQRLKLCSHKPRTPRKASNHQKLEGGHGTDSPQSPQNHRKTYSCCLSHSLSGTLLQQPWEPNKHMYFSHYCLSSSLENRPHKNRILAPFVWCKIPNT